jgi:hypothetical protein
MTPAEAERHLTRKHSCGCQEFWFFDPPRAMRCAFHLGAEGPCDRALEPEHLERARAILSVAEETNGRP